MKREHDDDGNYIMMIQKDEDETKETATLRVG